MSLFDSITHSMTTLATGGFYNYNESIGYFNNPLIIKLTVSYLLTLRSSPLISKINYLKWISLPEVDRT